MLNVPLEPIASTPLALRVCVDTELRHVPLSVPGVLFPGLGGEWLPSSGRAAARLGGRHPQSSWKRSVVQPCPARKSASAGDLEDFRVSAAYVYSLIRPPKTGFSADLSRILVGHRGTGASGSSSGRCWTMPWCGRAVLWCT